MITLDDYRKMVLLEDIWKESAVKSTDAFSKTINKEIEIVKNTVKIISVKELSELLKASSLESTVSWNRISGGIYGAFLLSATAGDILKLADILLHKETGHFKDLNNENVSVITTVTTLIADYYMDTLVNLFGKKIKLEKAHLSTNVYKATEYFVDKDAYDKNEDLLIFETDFLIPENNFNGKTILFFLEKSVKKIFNLVKA